MAPQPRQRIGDSEPTPAIMIGTNAARAGGRDSPRWGLLLIWFMRLTAVFWLMLGLYYWAVILGRFDLAGAAFPALSLSRQTAIVFFATLDLIAAVGLWLTTPWGGVVWLLTALAEIALAATLTRIEGAQTLALGVNGALVGIYFVLNIFAARERDAV